MEAYEGHAIATGIKKKSKLSSDDVQQLRDELEEAKRKHRLKYGNG